MKVKKDNRRQFLKNTSLSLLSFTALPIILKSTNSRVPLKNNAIDSCERSTTDAYGQGPFYTTNAPVIQNDQLAGINEIGVRIIISGQIYNIGCSEFIPNTEIDIWHANDAGEYDNVGYNLRGKTISNNQGFYIFESIKPGLYLNGTDFRPSHIHFKITPPGFSTLTTQLYFQGDPHINTDAAASISVGSFDATNRIIPLISNSNGDLEGTWDIIIDGDGIQVENTNIHIEKGIIYSANPNPFTNQININYGVFQKARVTISVYDICGQKVATIDQGILDPERYSVLWEPYIHLPKGHYFISILINDLQVHYLKVIRK